MRPRAPDPVPIAPAGEPVANPPPAPRYQPPATLVAGTLAVPAEFAANLLPGVWGTIASMAGAVFMIPAAWIDLQKWLRQRRKR